MPSWVVRDLLRDSEPAFTATDIRAARRVLVHQQAWLLPAPGDDLCMARVIDPLVAEIGGQRLHPSVERSCATRAAAEAGRLSEAQSLSTTFRKRIPTRVVGVVPDGVHNVTIHFDGSSAVKVTVTRNAFEDVLINPSAISFTSSTSGESHSVPLASVAGTNSAPYNAGRAEGPFTG